jgi:hypothetical protein
VIASSPFGSPRLTFRTDQGLCFSYTAV